MSERKIVSLEDRIPKLKEQRKRKANRRLIFLISIFFLLILFVVYFQSPLSHVKHIKVAGNQLVDTETVIKKMGISNKTNIWSIDKEKTTSKLLTIPEVKKATVKINFPNNVVVQIKEHTAVANISDGTKLLTVLESGNIVNQKGNSQSNIPILTNFKQGKILKAMVEQIQQLPKEIINSISEINYSPKKTDIYHITLYMNDGFEVSATIRTLASKIIYYPSIVSQLDPNVKGVIDLEVGSTFKPFKTEVKEEDGQKNDENQENER